VNSGTKSRVTSLHGGQNGELASQFCLAERIAKDTVRPGSLPRIAETI
jgi:hypothetical protein